MKRTGKRLVITVLCFAVCVGVFFAGNHICCVAEEKGAEYKLPIIMYHHILQETSKQGKFVISPKEFEEDLIYLQQNGYTTIGIQELLAYQEQGTSLPPKPVMLTFDDGYLSYIEYAVPLLKQYGMKAIVSVVGAYSDTYTENGDRCVSYAYFNWEDMKTLTQSDHTEIGNHTYDMHKVSKGRKGCARMKGENEGSYRKIFTSDAGKMQTLLEEQTGKKALCFTYPFGFRCGEAEEEIQKMGFRMSLCCEEGINLLHRESSLFCLKRFNREHKRSVASILEGKK